MINRMPRANHVHPVDPVKIFVWVRDLTANDIAVRILAHLEMLFVTFLVLFEQDHAIDQVLAFQLLLGFGEVREGLTWQSVFVVCISFLELLCFLRAEPRSQEFVLHRNVDSVAAGFALS